ncbi:MAG: ComEC/Rec2 family competence protein, partial [Firmicutes bacterium]|nr:ComEC/Rec2 family competence protein [Candidatus Caballimonas caccae]
SISGAINRKLRYDINVYSNCSNLSVGGRIKFKAYIHDYHETYNEKFSASFIAEKIKYYTYLGEDTIVILDNDLNVFERVNCFIKDTLKDGMDKEEFSIAYSLMLGKSDYMDDEVLSSFRETGVAHIFAVSGLHIGFLAVSIEFLLSKIKVKNPLRSIIIILAIFFYSGVCGFTASSIRACVMTAVLLLSNIKGKKYDMISSLSLAFLIILLISPMQLFCLGFQLSFGAVFGIILFANKIKVLFTKIKIPEKIAKGISASISAQIITFLIIIKNFSGVSVVSILVNVLLVPLVGLIFVLLFICVILGGAFSISNITLFIPAILIKCIKFLVLLFDRKVFLITFSILTLSFVLYYSCVLILSGLINIKIKVKSIASVILACSFIVTSIVCTNIENDKTKIYVSSNGSLDVTVIESSEERFVIVNNITEGISLSRLYSIIEKGEKIDGLVLLCDNKNDGKIYNALSRFNEYFNV